MTNHTKYYNKCRNDCLNQVASQTNNLIIRLDKLINRQSDDDTSRKDFEKKVVPWSDNSEFQNCRSCNAKFSLTRRKHHCRLCGKIMCNACSQFLSFTSARKLTGPEFANNIFSEDKFSQTTVSVATAVPSDKRTAMSRMTTEASLQFVKTKIGSFMGNGVYNSSSISIKEEEQCEEHLRICDVCKILLDRREEAMDLRTAHSVFVDVYQKLFILLTQISNLAPSYKHMAESLNKGESIYTLEAANELRRKLISVQREITTLSDRVEQWGLTEDPLITKKPNSWEIILQRNIKVVAINSLHDAISTMPDLPNKEQYEVLKLDYKEKLVRRIEMEKEREQKAQSTSSMSLTLRSFPSNPVLSTFSRDKRSSSPGSIPLNGGSEDRKHRLKPSTSLTVLKSEDGWVSNSPFQRNPFTEDESEQLNVVQQQYLNIKSYLQQAAQAGRLDEVEILEKSLAELESELKLMELPTPRLSSS